MRRFFWGAGQAVNKAGTLFDKISRTFQLICVDAGLVLVLWAIISLKEYTRPIADFIVLFLGTTFTGNEHFHPPFWAGAILYWGFIGWWGFVAALIFPAIIEIWTADMAKPRPKSGGIGPAEDLWDSGFEKPSKGGRR